MLYTFLKIPARLALHFYCRKITVNNAEVLQIKGPVLIAANHPNSFLDAVILATIFRYPVHSLTRGDVFSTKFFRQLLKRMNMMAVYRTSEGVENLGHNYSTFTDCQNIFLDKGIVLIFSEGLCINEWRLRRLKKGTARLAINAWQQNIPLRVLPVGINYSSFKKFGKNVIVNFGELIDSKIFAADLPEGRSINGFNTALTNELKNLVIEISPGDVAKRKNIFFVPQPVAKKIFLFLPSVSGWILHWPLYYLIVFFIGGKAMDHYDSVVVILLFIFYPLYLTLIAWLVFSLTKNPLSFILLLLIPFTAWAHLQLKKQF